MDRTYHFRIGIVILLIVLIAGIYSIRLFALQLTEDEETEYSSANTTTYKLEVAAARGEILDRHGNVLISNRASYNVTLQTFVLYNSDDPNGYLLSLAETCIKNGIEYQDRLPLSKEAPYTYTLDELTSSEQYYFKKYLLNRDWDADMTAESLANRLKKDYKLTDYTEEEARLIMGIRYELDLVRYANADTYVLTKDISAENLAILKELGIPGMDVETTTVREYNTTVAAQLLGHVGLMTEEEYNEIYEEQGYSMDATVGKDGLEQAFEEYLHGQDGTKVTTVAADGTVLDEYWEVEPQSGANVVTTLDIGLQAVAEEALANRINEMAEQGKNTPKGNGADAEAGAVVVMDPRNGEVLAAANYPTYDPNDYAEHYNELLTADGNPLANRALMYGYAPGSTFKMVTAVTALRHGFSAGFTVNATGVYTAYDDYQPKCWIYSNGESHGEVNMMDALAQSCNIYFYTLGDQMGKNFVDYLDEVAADFGLGEHSGSEVTDNAGLVASKEAKKNAYTEELEQGWWAADSLMAAIGQSLTRVTPLQLCRYTATIANGGTLYNATFLRRAVSSDFQTPVYVNTYTPVRTEVISESEYQVLKTGMEMCATEGTAAKYFENYDIEVACKTGTAQHGNGGSDNAAFVCWAPADDPQIAVAVYVEHGDTGGFFGEVAKTIMDYYFDMKDVAQEVNLENSFTTN